MSYIYPPRAKQKITSSGLATFQKLGFVAQPKLDGSCSVLFLEAGKKPVLMNRHKETFSRYPVDPKEFQTLHKGNGKMILTGEYLNKSKKNSEGEPLKGFVIFDILMYEGKHLLGTSQGERMELIYSLFESTDYDGYIKRIDEYAFVVNQFDKPTEVWNEIIQTDMYEGFVLKNPKGKLRNGTRPENNGSWQVKCRKPTKNYQY